MLESTIMCCNDKVLLYIDNTLQQCFIIVSKICTFNHTLVLYYYASRYLKFFFQICSICTGIPVNTVIWYYCMMVFSHLSPNKIFHAHKWEVICWHALVTKITYCILVLYLGVYINMQAATSNCDSPVIFKVYSSSCRKPIKTSQHTIKSFKKSMLLLHSWP